MRCTGWRTGLKPGSTERDDADWDAGRDEPKEATSTYRRQTPLAGAVGRLERIRRCVTERAQQTTPGARGRRTNEADWDAGRAQPKEATSTYRRQTPLAGAVGRLERIRRCVTERAQQTTPGARVRRANEADWDAGSAEPKEATSTYRRQTPLAGAVGRLERIRRCVTERAQQTTPGARVRRANEADWDAGSAEPKEATSTYRRQTPLAGAVGRLERIRRCVTERAQETTPGARVRRTNEADWDAGRAEPKEATSTYRRQTPLAGAVGRLERTRRCVTDRAQETTPGSAASAPKMRVRSGGPGLRPHPRPRCELVPAASGSGRIRARDASSIR